MSKVRDKKVAKKTPVYNDRVIKVDLIIDHPVARIKKRGKLGDLEAEVVGQAADVIDCQSIQGLMSNSVEELTKCLHSDCYVVVENVGLKQELARLTDRLHKHEGVEGGISSDCGHPTQCLYAAAMVDGGPVCCSMCDLEAKVNRLTVELKEKKHD